MKKTPVKKPRKASPYKETLSAKQLAGAEIVSVYKHPESARTVARHLDGEAYTVTGIHCGKIDDKAAAAAAKITGDGSGKALPEPVTTSVSVTRTVAASDAVGSASEAPTKSK